MVDWVRVPVVWGIKINAELYIGQQDGLIRIGVRGRF